MKAARRFGRQSVTAVSTVHLMAGSQAGSLADIFDAAVAAALRDWAAGMEATVQTPADSWRQARHKGVVLGIVDLIQIHSRHAERLMVQVCPAALAHETGRHQLAWMIDSEFARQHLVRQPYPRYPVGDGRFLMFQEISGSLRHRRTLDELGPDYLAKACEHVARLLLIIWNRADKGQPKKTVTVAEYLGLEMRLAERTDAWLRAAGLLDGDSDWITTEEDPDLVLPDPVRMALAGSLIADRWIDYLDGYSHGDLRLDNVLVQVRTDQTPLLESIRFIGLSAFMEHGPLTRDLAALVLSLAVRRARDAVEPREAADLLRFTLAPTETFPSTVVPFVTESIWAAYQVHELIPASWHDVWRRQYLLSLQAQALRYTGLDTLSTRERWWCFRLAAHAAAAFLELCGYAEPTTPRHVTTPADTIVLSTSVDQGSRSVARILATASRYRRTGLVALDVAHAVPRHDVVSTVLRELTREPRDEPGVVIISGAPGSGKTVIAGQVFDKLTAELDAAVIVVPCDRLPALTGGAHELAAALGRLVGEDSLKDAAAAVRSAGRRVVVLLDTVDYVLDERSRPLLIEALEEVHRAGADLVLTCRHQDFNALLRPKTRLGSLAPYLRRVVDVPPLTPLEVVDVTVSHLAALGVNPSEGRAAFAEKVRSLSAGGTSLAEITANPLMLLMLCELFAGTETVPPDLTTTRLCVKYCNQRIRVSRKYPDDDALVHAKERLWHLITGRLWATSDRTLSLSFVADDLLLDRELRRAQADMLSEGVLVPRSLDGGRLGFVHQIIVEYSVAIHLRDRQPDELGRLLEALRGDPEERWYAWQLIRHLVAVADRADAIDLLSKLDLGQVPAFRAAVLGAAAEYRPGLLVWLAERAVHVGHLLEALLSVHDEALDEALDVLAWLMRTRRDTAHAAARTAGLLLSRRPDTTVARAVAILETISGIRRQEPNAAVESTDQLVVLLLDPATKRGLVMPRAVLSAARSLVPSATPLGINAVLHAHLVPGVDEDQRAALVALLVVHPRGNSVKDSATDAVVAARPWSAPDAPDGPDALIRFLIAGPDSAQVLRAAAVAVVINRRPAFYTDVIGAFLTDTHQPNGQRLLICLREAARIGGAAWIGALLMRRCAPSAPGSLGRTCALLKDFSAEPAKLRHALADWLTPRLAGSLQVLDAYLALVYDDDRRVGRAVAYANKLNSAHRARLLANVASTVPSADFATIQARLGSDAEADPAVLRARVLGRAAATDATVRDELLALVAVPARLVSMQAIKYVQEAAEVTDPWLTPDMLSRFAVSDRESVRIGVLKAFGTLVRRGSGDAEAAVAAWLDAAHSRHRTGQSSGEAELVGTLDLAHSYLRDGVGHGPAAIAAIAQLVTDSTTPPPTGAAARKALLALAKTVMLYGDRTLQAHLAIRLIDALAKLALRSWLDCVSCCVRAVSLDSHMG